MSSTTKTTTRRPRLRRTTVVRAALSYIDVHGLDKLTMRALGSTLGVEAMSLYRHIASREDLLEAVAEQISEDLAAELDTDVRSCEQYIRSFAYTVRRTVLHHPRMMDLLVSRRSATPWLRPPLGSASLTQAFLESVMQRGLDAHAAVHAYRAVSCFLLGHLLLESSAPSDADARLDGEGARRFPAVDQLHEALSRDELDAEFDIGLDILVEHLQHWPAAGQA